RARDRRALRPACLPVDRRAGHAAAGHHRGGHALTSILALLGPGCKGATLSGKLTQQFRRFEIACGTPLRIFLEASQHRIESDLVGMEHRTPVSSREAAT